jgi:hypothetical protein
VEFRKVLSKLKGEQMLKKIIGSAILLAGMSASASENYFANEWDAKGLLAIEVAGGSFDLSQKNDSAITIDESTSAGSISLKLGGETKFYRLFLSGTYYQFDAPFTTESTAASLGLQVDYLIRAGEHFNIFLGLNGGVIRTDFQGTDTGSGIPYETNTDNYAGGQAGVNIDIVDNLGVELGVRARHVFTADNTYSIENMYEGYGSIVYKFTGEY